MKITANSQPYKAQTLISQSLVTLLLLVSIQLLSFTSSYAAQNTEPWSDSRLHAAIKSTGVAFNNKNWDLAIQLGEAALNGCISLLSERDRQCIRIMKNNSMAYFRAGELETNALKIEKAYRIASKELGAMHFSTIRSREVFHQLTLDQVRYKETIPLVIELIETERKMGNDEFKILDWLIQLYALYKIEGPAEKEIPTLLEMKALTDKLLGKESDQLNRTITVLADTYCEQKEYYDYYQLKRKHKLKSKCKMPINKRIWMPFASRK